MEKNLEVVKCIYDKENNLIAFFRKNTVNRTIQLYVCKEAEMEDIDKIFNLNSGYKEEVITTKNTLDINNQSIIIEDEKD